jgi:hypothetical protein
MVLFGCQLLTYPSRFQRSRISTNSALLLLAGRLMVLTLIFLISRQSSWGLTPQHFVSPLTTGHLTLSIAINHAESRASHNFLSLGSWCEWRLGTRRHYWLLSVSFLYINTYITNRLLIVPLPDGIIYANGTVSSHRCLPSLHTSIYFSYILLINIILTNWSYQWLTQ